jgi:hypothetical protein
LPEFPELAADAGTDGEAAAATDGQAASASADGEAATATDDQTTGNGQVPATTPDDRDEEPVTGRSQPSAD